MSGKHSSRAFSKEDTDQRQIERSVAERVERLLRETSEYIHQLANHIHGVLWMMEAATLRVCYVSPGYEEIWGRTCQSLYEDPYSFLAGVHPQDLSYVFTILKTVERHEPFDAEYRVVRPDGSLRWVWIRGFPIRNAEGQVYRYAGITEDITHRKHSEQALHDRLRFERLLAEMSADFLHLPAEKISSQISRWLERLASFLDIERVSLVEVPEDEGRAGEGLLQVTHSWAAPGHEPHRTGLSEREFPWSGAALRSRTFLSIERLEMLPEDAAADRHRLQELGTKSVLAIPLMVKDTLVGALCLETLIEPRTWSEELLSSSRLVGEVFAYTLVRQRMEARTARVEADLAHAWRVAALGELAAALAHELNQPLTAILTNAEATRRFLASGQSGEQPNLAELDEVLADIVADATRGAELIRRLREWLRRGEHRKAPLDINKIIRDVEAIAHADAVRHEATITLDLTPGLQPVLGDSLQLQQVVLNLVQNATEAMKDMKERDKEVIVHTRAASGGGVEVTVQDQGPFVSEETFGRMFDSLYTTKPGGMGLGLSISRSIVLAHGGRLWATRNPDRGLTFHLTLPRAGEAGHEQ
jgi:PAS domain S-box-containing protein